MRLDLSAGTLHRIVRHCPGEDRCLRDGCPPADLMDTDLLVARIVDKATVVASMLAGGDWATGAYLRAIVDGDDPGVYEEPGEIMRIVEQALADSGWQTSLRGSGRPAMWTAWCTEMDT